MAKAHYVGVNGIARKVKQPYIGVGGVARKVKNGYVGVGGVARQFFGGGIEVGQSLFLKLGIYRYEFIVVHKGLPSSAYDSSCDGIWLLKKSNYGTKYWDTRNMSYYKDSEIHTELNNETLGRFETGIQNLIKQVKLPRGGGTVSAKVFLLSYTEVFGGTNSGVTTEGAVLDYFDGASAADRICPAYDDGTGTNQWWLSSTYSYNQAWTVNTSGNASYYSKASDRALRPAIIVPHDIQVDSNFNIIA